jgi:hypothetical protein
MTTHLEDPAQWRTRAEQGRTLAKHMRDAASRQLMLNLAADYEYPVERAEERQKKIP